MLGHGSDVSLFTQFYDKIIIKLKIACSYVGSYYGEKGNMLFKEKMAIIIGKVDINAYFLVQK